MKYLFLILIFFSSLFSQEKEDEKKFFAYGHCVIEHDTVYWMCQSESSGLHFYFFDFKHHFPESFYKIIQSHKNWIVMNKSEPYIFKVPMSIASDYGFRDRIAEFERGGIEFFVVTDTESKKELESLAKDLKRKTNELEISLQESNEAFQILFREMIDDFSRNDSLSRQRSK